MKVLLIGIYFLLKNVHLTFCLFYTPIFMNIVIILYYYFYFKFEA